MLGRLSRPKRQQPLEDGGGKENEPAALSGGARKQSGYQSRPFKPPMPTRTDANGSGRSMGIRYSQLRVLGAGGLLQQLTRTVTVGRRLGAGGGAGDEGVEGPEVVLFEPEAYPDLPPAPEDLPYVKVTVDRSISGKLRPHQVEGLQFMFRCLAGLQPGGFTGCIQSDSMGLGKTFQSIAVMWCLLSGGLQGKPTCSRVLVIVPTSLVANWGREITKWLGERVKPTVIEDNSSLKRELARINSYSTKPTVCIMSYDVFRINPQAIYKKDFQLVICDEAHRLKNGASKINQAVFALPCKLRLLLTGTPIQNDLSEFFAMFNTACPGLFGTPAEFRKQFEAPILASRDAGATDLQVQRGAEASARLVETSQAYIIRRTAGVLAQYLPAKLTTVVFCRMSMLQEALFNGFLASEPVRAALEGRKLPNEATLSTLPAINALKKLCAHPALIWSMQAPAAGSTGAAAARASGRGGGGGGGGGPKSGRGEGGPTAVITGFEGLEAVFLDPKVSPRFEPGQVQAMHSGKMQVLLQLLKTIKEVEPTDKVVLVSNYTETLALIAQVCKACCWGALSLTGDLAAGRRQQLVDRFCDPGDPSYVLLLSSKAGGCGLNIVGANRLVLVDPSWNPADDLQAMGRVWREGQKKRVFIYRLLTTGSIEEKIYQRQLSKEGLSRVVVDAHTEEQRTFSKDELRALFKVDPTVDCDTHSAIRCKCMAGSGAKRSKPASPSGEEGGEEDGWSEEEGGGSGGGAEEQAARKADRASVLSWDHLAGRDLHRLPDEVWGRMSSWVRNTFVTFAFSDAGGSMQEAAQAQGEDDSDSESIDRAGAGGEEGEDREGGSDAAEPLDGADWEEDSAALIASRAGPRT